MLRDSTCQEWGPSSGVCVCGGEGGMIKETPLVSHVGGTERTDTAGWSQVGSWTGGPQRLLE